MLFDNAADGASAEAFEESVSLAASVAAELLRRGYRVAFVARGLHITGARGPGQHTRIMRTLALIAPVAATPDAPANDPSHELPVTPGPSIRIRPGRAAEAHSGRPTAPAVIVQPAQGRRP